MYYKNFFFHFSYQFPLIIKILLDSQMYVVTGVKFISFDKFLNFVCKNSKLKNESISPGLPYSIVLDAMNLCDNALFRN